jgi:hypothetical protein
MPTDRAVKKMTVNGVQEKQAHAAQVREDVQGPVAEPAEQVEH